MKNKEQGKRCAVAGLSGVFATLIISVYCIFAENCDWLLYGSKERKARTEQSQDFQEYWDGAYHDQQDVKSNSSLEKKIAQSDSMRAAHKQIEKDLFNKADSCYRMANWYQNKINIINDSISFALIRCEDTMKFSEQKRRYTNKRNMYLKQYKKYVDESCKKAMEHTKMVDSFWNNRNCVLEKSR